MSDLEKHLWNIVCQKNDEWREAIGESFPYPEVEKESAVFGSLTSASKWRGNPLSMEKILETLPIMLTRTMELPTLERKS